METPMQRRWFLGRLATLLGGFAVVPALATVVQARSRRRFRGGWGGWGGYRNRGNSHRRFIGPGYGGYYRGYGPRNYYAPRYYAPGPPLYRVPPRLYYSPGGYYSPLLRADTPALDALALLEL